MPNETHELPKAYDPSAIEQKWADFWVNERLFDVPTPADPASVTHPFVQLLPPPNVTGRLHMGHMLNQTEMDILARWHRMSGDTSVWIPGTDHAGIATQMMVERQLAAEGKKRTDFSREAFTEKVWEWKHQYGSAITDQMKRLGASVDWSREYFTMDDRLSKAVRVAFVRLYEQGLIYRGAYIVNWDPILRTAVSDLEVENEERAGHLYDIRYDLADRGAFSGDSPASITIATTRPETMLGDTAVAVNPQDARYQHLIGKELVLPLVGRNIPIVADTWANPEFGTGAVKVTPAHDPNDFAIGQRHNLPSPCIMDDQARIHLEGSPYHGLDRFEARKRIVADLEASGHLVKVADHTLTLPISQRTSAVIEPRLSMQWFLAVNKAPQQPGARHPAPEPQQPGAPHLASEMWEGSAQKPARNSIAQNAIDAVNQGHIKFTPDMYTKTYNEWMSNIHDWCISRQLWWGHRIPAWHCDACGKITVTLDTPPACHGCGITDIHQETDVLDTWFSSGLLPFTVFGWGNPSTTSLTPDLAAFYPTQLLVTGFDILFFWVARMIMLGTHFMLDVPMPSPDQPDGSKRELKDAVPFRNVYIHALVRDADRQKMSKTKGNVIDPIEIITRYGTDAVRFTLASQASPGTDIAFNEARTEGYRAFANKIWNAARFLQMNIDRAHAAGYKVTLGTNPGAPQPALSPPKGLASEMRDAAAPIPLPPTPVISTGAQRSGETPVSTPADASSTTPLETRWILSRLSSVSAEVARSLADFRFDEASSAVYQFFWGEFCDWYLELVKLRLNFDQPADPTTALTLNALVTTFEAALRLLSPFMPFLTEELWHALYASIGDQTPAKSIALTRYPQAEDFPSDLESVRSMDITQQVIVTIRSLRKDLGIPEKEAAPVKLSARTGEIAFLADSDDYLPRLARVSSIDYGPIPDPGPTIRSTEHFDVAVLYQRQIDIPAERERLTKDLAKFNKGIEAAEKQLNNPGFLSKAPADKVEGLRKQYAETLALQQKAEAALAALPLE